MKFLLLYLSAILAVQISCRAEVTKLSVEDCKVLQDATRFHEVLIVTNLPEPIVELCADGKGRFAEPGQKWEATDVITDDKLPQKRLIWAMVADGYYVVHYERGGYAHSFHVLIATFKQGDTKVKVVWRGVGDKLKDYKGFLTALENNKLDDTRDYAY